MQFATQHIQADNSCLKRREILEPEILIKNLQYIINLDLLFSNCVPSQTLCLKNIWLLVSIPKINTTVLFPSLCSRLFTI